MSKGFYKMERGWMEHPFFSQDPLTEREAWEWMISEAAFEDRVFNLNGNPVKLERGQFSHSLRFLAEKWCWNKDKVARFLERLKKWSMIETTNETAQTLVTICNYAKYQDTRDTKRDSKRGKNETEARQGRDKEEGIKKEDTSYRYDGNVIRLNDADFDRLHLQSGLSKEVWIKWLGKEDDYLASRPPEERANWWHFLRAKVAKIRA
jgi:hypothetical protein